MKKCSLITVLLACITACVIETFPLPEVKDLPIDIDDVRDHHSPPTLAGGEGEQINERALYYHTHNPGLLVGVRLAVPALSRVVALNDERSNWQGETDATVDGRFNMPLHAGIGDLVEISALVDGAEVDSVILYVESPSVNAFANQADLDAAVSEDGYTTPGVGAVTVMPPDAMGLVTVSGNVDSGISVVIANIDNGSATSALAASNSTFTVQLAGASGDMLQLFVVEAAASNAGPPPATLYVP